MRLSVIVPVYKVENYIDKCISSILSQEFTDFELILVDDGSPDSCPQLCDEYARRDPRVIVIHKDNGGLSSARNAGLKIASGDFVSFIDSDDWISSDFYNSIHLLENCKEADIIYVPYDIVYENHTEKVNYGHPQLITEIDKLYEFFFSSKHNLSVWKCIYRRSLFDDLQFKEGYLFEDCYLSTKMVQLIKGIITTDIGCYHYIMRSGSICNSSSDIYKVKQHLDAYKQIIEFLRDKKIPFDQYKHYYTTYLYFLLKGYNTNSKNENLSEEIAYWNSCSSECIKNLAVFSMKTKGMLLLSRIVGINLLAKLIRS